MTKNRTKAIVVMSVLAILLTACSPYQFQGAVIDPAIPAPEIALQDQFGEEFVLSGQRGRVVLLFFGYTYCPDVCPATLGDFKYIRTALEGETDIPVFVFVTVDPERDTPEKLAAYLGAFHEDFLGLTGDLVNLEAIYQDYGVSVLFQDPNDLGGYLVEHTARMFVIDQHGRLRLTFPFGVGRDAMLADVREILKESNDDK